MKVAAVVAGACAVLALWFGIGHDAFAHASNPQPGPTSAFIPPPPYVGATTASTISQDPDCAAPTASTRHAVIQCVSSITKPTDASLAQLGGATLPSP